MLKITKQFDPKTAPEGMRGILFDVYLCAGRQKGKPGNVIEYYAELKASASDVKDAVAKVEAHLGRRGYGPDYYDIMVLEVMQDRAADENPIPVGEVWITKLIHCKTEA